jgi:transposase InsO family protein
VGGHSRIALSAILPDETAASASALLQRALAYFARLGIVSRALLTDNSTARRSHAVAACRRHGLKHRFARPCTPRTNGKAERFIQTALREWAYARTYQSSQHRSQEPRSRLHQYNWHRPHASLGLSPPVSRSGLAGNSLPGLHR